RLLERAGYREKYLRLAEALDQENTARAWLAGFLREHHIENVDLLPALEAEVEEHDLFPPTDGHPNKDGYRVIAETVNRYLNSPHNTGGLILHEPVPCDQPHVTDDVQNVSHN